MHLIYIDESGDTGLNLKDAQQPIFVLCALPVPEDAWHRLESAFMGMVATFFDGRIPSEFELHTTDLKSRRGFFEGFTPERTFAFRDRVFELVEQFGLQARYMRILKKDFDKFCQKRYGSGVKVEPYFMALPFLCRDIDRYLAERDTRGILIFDEHRMASDIDKSLWTLRLDGASSLRTERIVEKGFSIESRLSVPLQLSDFLAYYLRKWEEHKAGFRTSPHDQIVFPRLGALAQTFAVDGFQDIFAWVDMETLRKQRPGTEESGRPVMEESRERGPLTVAEENLHRNPPSDKRQMPFG
jgi:hypothetical protein